jgi:RimJ/RimL family protein N-acetyltransferase
MRPALIPERIEAERLVLRRNTPADRVAFMAVWADPQVWSSLIGGDEPNLDFAADRHARQVEHWERHGFGLYVVEIGGEVAGWCGPSHPDYIPDLADEIEIGWTLRSDFWGRGYASEAARTAVDVTFACLAPERTISLIAPGNSGSCAVAERLAMRKASQTEIPESGMTLDVWELRRSP